MRRLAPLVLLFLVAGGLPAASSSGNCTIIGSSNTDFLAGTDHRDVICGRGGNDFISGGDGNDRLRGGGQNDTVVGGAGADHIRGRAGNDRLFVVDAHGNDKVWGGPGMDKCYGEKGDIMHCEKVSHSSSPSYPRALALALTRALGSSITVAHRKLCRADVTVCVDIS